MSNNILIGSCNLIVSFLLSAVLLSVVPAQAFVQDRTGDYDPKPQNEVDYSQLEVHLEVGFEARIIRGEATYFFQPKHSYVDSLNWQIREMEIETISLDGEEIPYQLNDNLLSIAFENYLPENETTEIRITYKAEPSFGVHFKPNGTIFTSNLPESVSHWLPGPIHPRVVMPVRFEIEVPEGMKAVSTGDLENQSATDKGSRFIRASNDPVSIADLGFAVGLFELSETFSGTKSLGIYHENETLTDDERQELLGILVNRNNQMERFLRSELPVNSFHAVIIEDDRWETRSYAAGMAFLFQNQNQIETQLGRSLSAQWLGISLRPVNWQEYQFTVLLQASMAEELDMPDWHPQKDALREAFQVPMTLYQNGSMDQWQWARSFIRNYDSPVLKEALSESLQEMASMKRAWTNLDFSNYLYDKTGKWIEISDFQPHPPEREYRFLVKIEEVRGSDKYIMDFIPEANLTNDSIQVPVNWVRDGRIYENVEQITGRGGRLEIDPGGFISNLWISRNEDSDVIFTEEKPFSFWLYQIRRDDDPYRRKIAAEALIDFTSDPDLQLALQDRVSQEQDPDVIAAIYKVLADLTAGASGTERRFLDGLTNSNAEIRLISMDALKSYKGTQRVEDEVLSIIQTSDDIALVNRAIRTYRHLLDEEEYREFVLRFLREDRQDFLFTETLLEELFELPLTDASVEMAAEYLQDGYSFDLRWLSYYNLRSNAGSSGWQKDFANAYSNDSDPRIRFITLFSLSEFNSQERRLFFEERMLQEYDIRILTKVKEMLSAE